MKPLNTLLVITSLLLFSNIVLADQRIVCLKTSTESQLIYGSTSTYTNNERIHSSNRNILPWFLNNGWNVLSVNPQNIKGGCTYVVIEKK